jgi:hypothetical protein
MFDKDRMMGRIEELLQKPFWVVDILSEQVKSDSPSQYFEVEKYYLESKELRRKQLNVLLRLNCYFDFCVWIDSEPVKNPSPNKLKEFVGKTHLNIEVGNGLLVVDPADTHMTMYNAEGKLMEMVKQLATAEGLFIWRPGMNESKHM